MEKDKRVLLPTNVLQNATGGETPARIFTCVINRPGCYLTAFDAAPLPRSVDNHLCDGARLLGTVLSGFSWAHRRMGDELVGE